MTDDIEDLSDEINEGDKTKINKKVVKIAIAFCSVIAITLVVYLSPKNDKTYEDVSLSEVQIKEGDAKGNKYNVWIEQSEKIKQQQDELESQQDEFKAALEKFKIEIANAALNGSEKNKEIDSNLAELDEKIESEIESIKNNTPKTTKAAEAIEIDLRKEGTPSSSEKSSFRLGKNIKEGLIGMKKVIGRSKNNADDRWLTSPKAKEFEDRVNNKLDDALPTSLIDKRFTIPAHSVLNDAVSLTYLIGRIPVDGRVIDPYPVKIQIGKENFMANGHDLPDIESMIFSGYATGDLNNRCIRVELNAYTFIFNDGRVVTFNEGVTKNGAKEPLGWVSDPKGQPCISGQLVSNAGSYFAKKAGVSLLTSFGASVAEAQISRTTNINGSSSEITGDTEKLVLGNTLSKTAMDVDKWSEAREGDSFDAIVETSNVNVVVNITRNIEIDYIHEGRKVKYDKNHDKSTGID